MRIGAHYAGNGICEFVVWAPFLKAVSLKIVSPRERILPMVKGPKGYWEKTADHASVPMRYVFMLEGELERPDPASRFQPEGIHGPSETVDHGSFHWEDSGWQCMPLADMIMYELHVGTFTPGGTFDSIISRLPELKDSGINAIELMPVAQFPGDRNWGYDGTYPFAVQNSYGGPAGLKRLVNACHKNGMAVILDVVYNHLGPEGNYLRDYGPYFTDKYRTPWGSAINFDDEYSNEVRNFFIENALHWFEYYHLDALRLDAIHGISDLSARPFLQELAERAEEFSLRAGKKFYLIAESDLNDSRVIRPRESGGYGIDAQWCDDYHHCIHTLLTGEKNGYYMDFGTMGHLVKSFREGYVYSGDYSGYRKRNHGNSSKDIRADQLVVFSQNHDQTGNRMLGERLSQLVSFESLKLAAGIVLLSPYIPLLFMGEEYGEEAPFVYFISHSDRNLVDAIRKGRKEEFRAFKWRGDPLDPQDSGTFLRSKIAWEKRGTGHHKVLLDFYRQLITLRTQLPALSSLDRDSLDVEGFEDSRILAVSRWKGNNHIFCIFNFHESDMKFPFPHQESYWEKILDSSDLTWEGPGTLLPEKISGQEELTLRGRSIALFSKELGS